MSGRLYILAMGAFCIGTATFMMAGILPSIAGDLAVSVPVAGSLITVFALSYAIGSPVLSTLLGDIDRKLLLIGSLAIFALANVLSATAPNFTVLALSQVLMAVGAGLYMPNANAVAVALSPVEKRGRAIAIVTGGLTTAVAFGVPAGMLISGLGTWRLPFVAVAVMSAIAIAGLSFGLPRDLPRGTASLADRLRVIRRRDVLLTLATTVAWLTGVYSVYPYLAVLLRNTVELSNGTLSLLLFVLGVGSAFGNSAGGTASDRFGPIPTLLVALSALAFVFLAFSFLSALPETFALSIIVVLLFLWGALAWVCNPSQASRLVDMAPHAASIVLSLNASALYVGFAAGASVGSLVISFGGYEWLGVTGAAFQLVALAFVLVARRPFRRDAAAMAPRSM